MDTAFKKHLQGFLKRWGENPERINYDTVSDFDSLWNQLGIEKDLAEKPIELLLGLKFLFDLHEEKFNNDDITCDTIFSIVDGEWVMEEPSEKERLIKKRWTENTSKYTMGNSNSLQGEQLNTEMLTIEIADTIKFYQCTLQDTSIDIKGLKDRLRRGLNFEIELFDQERYMAEICKTIYFL